MANQITVSLSSEWQSLNSLSGADVGVKIEAQVISGRDVRVIESDSQPDMLEHGFKFSVGKFFRVDYNSREVWVRGSLDGDLAKLEVEYE